MITFGKVILGLVFRKRFPNMPGVNSTDLRVLEDKLNDGEHMISYLKGEIKQLLSVIVEKRNQIRVKSLQEENKKLQNQTSLLIKELIKLQTGNGVPQIPVPESEIEIKDQPVKSFSEELDKSDTLASSENVTIKSKPNEKLKHKKNEPTPDFSILDIRVGKILHAQRHPDADSLYFEQIDVGEEISRTVVSGLVRHMTLADLDERMVVVLCNLKPQKMRGMVSEAMVLCASTPQTVELLTPPPGSKPGDNVTVYGYPRKAELPIIKKKTFDEIAEDLKVNSKKQATYKDIPWEVEGRPGFVTVQALTDCEIL